MKVYIPKYLKEKFLVDELEQILIENGCSVLEPEDVTLEKGNHAEEVMKTIQKCDLIISFLTPEAINSQGWRRELEFAQKNGKGIILLKVLEYEAIISSTAYEALPPFPIIEWGPLGKCNFPHLLAACKKYYLTSASNTGTNFPADQQNPTEPSWLKKAIRDFSRNTNLHNSNASRDGSSKGCLRLIIYIIIGLAILGLLLLILKACERDTPPEDEIIPSEKVENSEIEICPSIIIDVPEPGAEMGEETAEGELAEGENEEEELWIGEVGSENPNEETPEIIDIPVANITPVKEDKEQKRPGKEDFYIKYYSSDSIMLEFIRVFPKEGGPYYIMDQKLLDEIEKEETPETLCESRYLADTDNSNNEPEEAQPSFSSNESPSLDWLWIVLAVIVTGGIGFWIYYQKGKKIRIKLVSNQDCKVLADNNEIAELTAMNVSFATLSKGQYFLRFEPKDKEITSRSTSVTVKNNDQLINIEFPEASSEKKNIIKCFIAGSTKLEAERNALRSGIAQTHNAWRGKNFEILSYTYEDFDKKVVEGGHQSKYDDFIQNDATLAIFIISGEIGKYTIKEFNKAMKAFKNGNHPQILIFNDANAPQHKQSETLKKMVAKEKQYWTDYDSISTLKLQFMHTLDWMLIDLFHNK